MYCSFIFYKMRGKKIHRLLQQYIGVGRRRQYGEGKKAFKKPSSLVRVSFYRVITMFQITQPKCKLRVHLAAQ